MREVKATFRVAYGLRMLDRLSIPSIVRLYISILEFFEVGPYNLSQIEILANTGRLCATCSGDGKGRLFVVGNYINPRLLYPVLRWSASVLASSPMDRTSNQTAPLDKLKGVGGTVRSLESKSATDRWRLLLLFEFMQSLFDRKYSFVSAEVHSALDTNVFDVAFVKKEERFALSPVSPLETLPRGPSSPYHTMYWCGGRQNCAIPDKGFSAVPSQVTILSSRMTAWP